MRAPCVSSLQPGARFKVANSLVLFSTRKDRTIIVRYSRGTKRAYAASFMRGNVCLVEDTASILLQFATIVTTFCGVTGIFTRANVKLAAKC